MLVDSILSSPAMVIQVPSEDMYLPARNGVGLSSALQLNEQFSSENDNLPKVRKPYTIKKQRERWSDEEHKKFIEALKLYGRAWRRIEEHVGTKTAVQIRSHAQKFFSKVNRETSGCNTSSVEPVEIPPPRPKRKPMHPYPRKLVNRPIKEPASPDQMGKSSKREKENLSPISVLASDTFGSTHSDAPNGSLSPVSSVVHGVLPHSGREDNTSPSIVPVAINLDADEQHPLKLFSGGRINASEEVVDKIIPRTIKLFGMTFLLEDTHKTISPTSTACKSQADINEGKPIQPLARKVTALESGNSDSTLSLLPIQAPRPICITGKLKLEEAGSVTPPPCGTQLSLMPLGATNDFSEKQGEEKNIQMEGSSTGSTSGSVNDGGDAESHLFETLAVEFKTSKRSAFSRLLKSAEKQMKGFVPYKKRKVEEIDTHSSTITGEHKTSLCL